MIDVTLQHDRDALLEELRLAGASVNGAGIRCPFHDDRNPSMSTYRADDGIWRAKCHGCDFCGDIFDVRAKRSGAPLEDVLHEVGNNGHAKTTTKRRIVATYDYVDAGGALLFQAVRYEPKIFRQRRPDGNGGWTWKLDGVARVLYRLRDVNAAQAGTFIYITEGEKDADRLAGEGMIATTCPMGAGKWKYVDDTPLEGRDVVLPADADSGGRAHAEDVAQRLHGRAASVRVLDLWPDRHNGSDVSDWLDAGHDVEDLWRLAEAAPQWRPTDNDDQQRKTTTAAAVAPLASTRGSDIVRQNVDFLWPGRFALGKLNLLVAEPDIGKTTLAIDIAARVTSGAPWPDRPNDPPRKPGDVLVLSLEDGAADTLLPRFDRQRGRDDRLHIIDGVRTGEDIRTFNLGDVDRLDATITAVNQAGGDVRLVILDPLDGYCEKTTRTHENASVRSALGPLCKMAEHRHVAILGVMHTRKMSSAGDGGLALDRVMGSRAWGAAARMVWGVYRLTLDPRRRLFVRMKGNLAPHRTGLAYQFERDGTLSWLDGEVRETADELARGGSDDGRPSPKTDEAVDFLRDYLKVCRFKSDVDREAAALNISGSTIKRAKQQLDNELRRAGKRLVCGAVPGEFQGRSVWRIENAEEREDHQSVTLIARHTKDVVHPCS